MPAIDKETTGTTSRVLSDAVTGQGLDLTDSNGDTAAFLVDGIGNQVGTLTDAGSQGFTASYDPYGTGGVDASYATSPFWTQNPYGFKAGTRTSAGQNTLVKFGLRWYLAGVGNWTQEDTLDSPLDPSNADRYAYAGSDPVNNSDPDGRESLYRTIASALGYLIDGESIGEALGHFSTSEIIGSFTGLAFDGVCGAVVGALLPETLGGSLILAGACYLISTSAEKVAEMAANDNGIE